MLSQPLSFRAIAARLAPAAAGLALLAASNRPGHAAESYVIPESDGYGISECLQGGSECGRVVADSWCESHGHAHVLAFGTVEDVTGAIKASAEPAPTAGAPGDFVIRCDD